MLEISLEKLFSGVALDAGDKRNAELEAAPWVSEWWKLIKASRAKPEEVIERIASVKALNTQQQEDCN